MNEERPKGRSSREQGRLPLTVGVLLSWFEDEYQTNLWQGIFSLAQERGVNLIAFAGGLLRSPYRIDFAGGFEAERNVIYDLVSAENVAGLVVMSSALSSYVSAGEMKAFCEQYRPLPVVSIAQGLPDIPSVLVDNRQGTREAVQHLVEHGRRRIAFVRGPEGHQESEERYEGYVEAMSASGIGIDSSLVAAGRFSPATTVAAIDHLLDEEIDFDGVATANDYMALSVMEALQNRGVRVPEDVAVVGFDGIAESQFAIPPLTTVTQPLFDMGRRALELVLAQVSGERVPEKVVLPTELVLRQSCGCPSAKASKSRKKKFETLDAAIAAEKEPIVLSAALEIDPGAGEVTRARVERLVDALITDLGAESAGAFLPTLAEVLNEVAAAGDDAIPWHHALSTLRQHMLPYLDTKTALARSWDLWHRAQVMIGDAAQRVWTLQTLPRGQSSTQEMLAAGHIMAAAVELSELVEAVVWGLPRVGIEDCYVMVYQGPQVPAPRSRLILAYRDGEQVSIEEEGRLLPTRGLVPDDLLPAKRPYAIVVRPLYVRHEHFGLLVSGTSSGEGSTEVLRGQLSSALMGMVYVREGRSRALQLQTAAEISQAASSILDPDDLIQQVVELTRERFGLYYVGLFLVDATGEWTRDAGRWAVLRAGTGSAGKAMLEQGHKLEVGGESMIGWCIAHKQARIALDVGKESVRFDNPLLPETRSEMGLPLISRGEVVGALSIQSAEEAAFSEQDVAIMKTMAGQVANAIENARLFNQTQATLKEMEAIHRRYLQQAWTEYLQSVQGVSYDSEHADAAPLGDAVLPEVQKAIEQHGTVILDADGEDRSALVAPIVLRGEAIGALGIHDDATRQWTHEEVTLVEAVVQRMALAAENLRLLDETQRRAARERLVGETTTRIRETLDVSTVMRTAADEMYKALGLDEVVVRLTVAEADNGTE